jgi:methenyltetrahydrofolate cyclohydrolase
VNRAPGQADGAARELSARLDSLGPVAAGGGPAAAVVSWLAVAVTGTAAGHARLPGLQAQADALRGRAAALAVADADAFARALAALHGDRRGQRSGDRAVEAALDHGVEVLLEIAALAADAAVLGGAVADAAEGDFRADAVAAAMLAAAAAHVAAHLVGETLLVGAGDERLARARMSAEAADHVQRRCVLGRV